jgi:hypothetical protein
MTTTKQLPPWAFQPQERAFAKAAGEKTYFTGRPCKYGHVVQRCTSSGVCVECSKTIQKRTLQKKLALNPDWYKEQYAKNPEITAIGVDSFSAYTDLVMAEARQTQKGYDIFNFYNDNIAKFFDLVKKIKKEVVLTAHYEILGIEGAPEKRVKVKGKEWEGVVEKEFTIVLFGDSKFKENGKPDYFFKLVEENTSAKCPPAIFGEDVYQIPNDVQTILEHIHKFKN